MGDVYTNELVNENIGSTVVFSVSNRDYADIDANTGKITTKKQGYSQ